MFSNPFKEIPPELLLMLASIGDDSIKIQNLLNKPINWDLLLQMAVHHRVYPLVYKRLNQLNKHTVSEHVLCLLRQKCQENAMQALSMTGETIRLIKSFESHGIHSIVLKGVPLAWRLYGDIALRPSKDIDILIQPNELEIAQVILENADYRRIHNEHNLTPRQLQIYLKANSHPLHIDYWHSKKRINLELHWKSIDCGYVFPLTNESSLNRIEVAGTPLPVLSDEEWLLYLMLHGAGHGWFRLRWLIDIVKFAQQGSVNWEKTALLAKDIGMQSILHQSLILANRLLELPVPHNLLSAVANDRFAWRLACMAINLCLSTADYEIRRTNKDINYLQFIYSFQVRKGWKSRSNYVMKMLFRPTLNDIKLRALPDRLYALYYVIHPFSSLGRHLRKLMMRN